MLCKATYIKKANLIKVTSNEVGYLLKPVLGLEPVGAKVRIYKRSSNQISKNQATAAAHLAQMQALPLAASGT